MVSASAFSFSATRPSRRRDILQPAAIVLLEEIAHDDAASRLIGFEADEQRALVGGPNGALRQHAADLIGLLAVGALDRVPDLLLTGVIGRHGEGHELLQRHAVFGIDGEELFRDGGEAQPLLHHVHRDEEGGGDLLLGLAFLTQRLESAELVERMKRRALDVFGQGVFLGDAALAHDARDRGGLCEPLLLDQQFERPVAAAAGRNLEHAGLLAFGVEHRPDAEALQERAPGDILGQLFDRNAGLHAPDIRLAEHQLVEGNVARGRQGDLLNGSSHMDSLRDGRREPLSRPPTRHGNRRSPLTLSRAADPESRKNVSTDDRFTFRRRRIMQPFAHRCRRLSCGPRILRQEAEDVVGGLARL